MRCAEQELKVAHMRGIRPEGTSIKFYRDVAIDSLHNWSVKRDMRIPRWKAVFHVMNNHSFMVRKGCRAMLPHGWFYWVRGLLLLFLFCFWFSIEAWVGQRWESTVDSLWQFVLCSQ